MSKIVIAMAFAVGLIAGIFINLSLKSSHAQDRPTCRVPVAAGSVKASDSFNVVFEALDGTVRMFNVERCAFVWWITRH